MSKLTDLPKRIVQSLMKAEKKVVTYPVEEKLKRFKEKYQDAKENRELLVVDKFGNRYYQYYSHHGLPTKRVVINNQKGFNKWDDDPYMLSWLERRRNIPPTQEELEKMYLDNEEFQRRGLEWDRKEQALIDEWKRKQKEALDKEKKETKAIGEGNNFSPGAWDKNPPQIPASDSALVEVKEEKRLVEGASTLPGKYIMDFKEEDEKYMKKLEEKYLEPYKELHNKVDWSKYSFEKMLERRIQKDVQKQEKLEERKQELTNTGKRMLEKKEMFSRYNNFREKFKDVFEDNNFS